MADAKAIARRLYDEGVNRGNVNIFDEILAPDFVEHEETLPGLPPNRETVKEFMSIVRNAFPDVHMDVDDLLQDGDKVVARVTMSGTHQGEFMGIPPTGKQFEVQLIDILQFRDDRCVAHWGVTDTAKMMEQLGITEPPG